MSVLVSDPILCGSADMPEVDGVPVGGAPDFTISVSFTNLTTNDTVDWLSSSTADTAVRAQIAGRDASGGVVTPAVITLTGHTKVLGLQVFQRLLYGIITGAVAGSFPLANPGGTAAVGDVACLKHIASIAAHTAQTGSANSTSSAPALFHLQTGDGASVYVGQIINTTGGTGPNQLRSIVAVTGFGTDVVAVNRDWSVVPDNTTTYDINVGMLFPILPNPVTKVVRCFSTAAADIPSGSPRYFYEKIFAVNNNTITDLDNVGIQILGESPLLSSGVLLDIGLAGTLDDTNVAAARQQASGFLPTGVGSFVTQPAPVSPAGGILPAGAAPNAAGTQAVWLRLTLPAGAGAYNGASSWTINGQTI